MKRKKVIFYFLLFLLTIPLGLATRYFPDYFPTIIKVYGGDILYASCLYFFLRMLFPSFSIFKTGSYSFLACIIIELQQLYKAPWIVGLRHTFPFGLVLGYEFVLSDCICYLIGSVLGVAVAYLYERPVIAYRMIR
jgi:hypothetical protein